MSYKPQRQRFSVERNLKRNSSEVLLENKKLLVSNLPEHLNWQKLKDLFREQVGDVFSADILRDDDGKSIGSGLVCFRSTYLATKALEKMQDFEFYGNLLEVKEATEEDLEKYGVNFDGTVSKGKRARKTGPPDPKLPCKVFVRDLPKSFKWPDVKEVFEEQVGRVIFIEIYYYEDGMSKGCGLLEFETEEMAKKAIERMNHFEMKGRPIAVMEARDETKSKYSKSNLDSSDPDEPLVGNETFGLAQEFLASLGINSSLTNKIFVGNLDSRVDERKLWKVFQMAGKILDLDISKDRETGKSRCFAFIEFTHPVEAVQSISMFNGQPLFERPMNVRLDKQPMRATRPSKHLPEGIERIGMGLGDRGLPLTDVAINLSKFAMSMANKSGYNLPAGLSPLANQMNMGPGNNSGFNSNPWNFEFNQGQMGPNRGGGYQPPQPTATHFAARDFQPVETPRRLDESCGIYEAPAFTFNRPNPIQSEFRGNAADAPNDSVIIRNLPDNLNWQDLQDQFKSCGEILKCFIKEPGVGIVKFATPRSADRALIYHSTERFGKIIDVMIY